MHTVHRDLVLSPGQWREDLHFLVSEVHTSHKNPFHLVSKAHFDHAVASLDARISALQDYEIVVKFQQLMAMIGDGHTFLATWDIQHVYPLKLFWFEHQLRVIATVAPYQPALGTRLVAINGIGVTEAHTKLQHVIPQGENEWYVLHQSAEQLTRVEVLAALGIVPISGPAAFTFEDDQGQQFTIPITPVAPRSTLPWISAVQHTPWYLQRPSEPLWFTALPDANLVYVNFRRYDDVAQHARTLWAFIDAQMPTQLVIDLRQNGGGNYTLGRSHVVYEIQKRSALNQSGRLFVVIGRGTFSAAMTNATDFRRETDAILVGEPTGARPRGYQENYWLTLPHFGVRASLASQYYKFQDVDTPAVMPDQLIGPNWIDYQAGRDPVLEWIVARTQR